MSCSPFAGRPGWTSRGRSSDRRPHALEPAPVGQPSETGFSGFAWDDHYQVSVLWRNGESWPLIGDSPSEGW